MAKIVYANFDQSERAEAAAAVLNSRGEARPSFSVQSHSEAPLDGNFLPEAATEIGRNTMIANVAGGIIGLIIGLVIASTMDIMGLTPALGAILGLVTGVLLGLLSAMMAGTREPKAALREAALRLPPKGREGSVLITVEVDDPGHVEVVEDILAEYDGDEIGVC
ncbi:hypothetical protein G6O69_18760 [Pseudenhygromyxa sp. WMMC2535]|uniref:hypothetical protein n=1 Tax=Pseudenhygromyxa sp. WMMC2535 TaxID=2712867 RepID=UPI0015523B62|nr:hypothetical protein [Pseudenhygromyxa sp. WMMC2535]NVB39892.1 hypothetical protein [Pseudenhygromyxa sp. WMMC2535]